MTISGSGYRSDVPGPACPDELRWKILRAAKAGDRRRHDELLSEAAEVERVALATRTARAVAMAGEGRLFT